MLKVIELDNLGKDADGYVFTLSIAGERFGITDQEVAEMIRTKHGASKGTAKRPAPRKASAPEPSTGESLATDPESRPPSETGEVSAH